MPVDESAFEAGKTLGLSRAAAAFGRQVLGIDTADAETVLREVILSYDNADRALHTRFTILFVELGISGYIARQHTGDLKPEFTYDLLAELAKTLVRALNSLTHDPPTGDEQ